MIFIIWIILGLTVIGIPIGYLFFMSKAYNIPWNLKIKKNYEPYVTILVPAHNEEKIINLKLKNLKKIQYPQDKIEFILVNDCSTDNTINKAYSFLKNNVKMNLNILNITQRVGKAKALNHALKKANGEIIIVSDADCFLPSDILIKSLPYLSDQSVGVITGIEVLLNEYSSWVNQTEVTYNTTVQKVRIGESKIQSTLFFQGGFGAYKRSLIKEFDYNTDDSGTALNLVQKNNRTILIPEAKFYTTFPNAWKSKIKIKNRRAKQLIHIWIKCLKLLIKGELVLSKKICLPETFLYIFNPILFIFFGITSLFLIFENPILVVVFSFIFIPIFIFDKTRILFVEFIQDNLILVNAYFGLVISRDFFTWKSVEGSRSFLTPEILKRKNLI